MDKLGRKNAPKIAVAMSGGVDSSVAAAILKKAGFSVTGVFMKLNDFSSESQKRARKTAKILKIPFQVFNFEKEFERRIISCFLAEYKAGRTPNPCVACNKEIKFGLLLEKALKLGANFVATGHYARLKKGKKTVALLKGKDENKDQSYFLWRLGQPQLKRILFPVGGYRKNQVRDLAKKLKLPSFKAPESQEICFIPAAVNDFLKKNLKGKKGRITDKKGKVLGSHQGLWFYTIGQRKGIGLAGGPYYVMDKDLKKNLLIVTKNKRDLFKKQLLAKEVNWISGKEPKLPMKIKAKIRYRHQPTAAVITRILNSKSYILKFKKSQSALTPGQSAVFYKGEELLGGGIIC